MDKYGTKAIFDNITTDRLVVRPAELGDCQNGRKIGIQEGSPLQRKPV